MRMRKTSQKIIDAIQRADDAGDCTVSETTIFGQEPAPPETGPTSVVLATLNGKGDLTLLPFMNAGEVTEFCAALLATSDTMFGDGKMQPEVVIEN